MSVGSSLDLAQNSLDSLFSVPIYTLFKAYSKVLWSIQNTSGSERIEEGIN